MHRRNLAWVVGNLVAGALLTFASSVLADERTEARAHFKKGMDAIGTGKYEEGVEELQRAYEILPHPNVLFNIARAYVDMGNLESAVSYYKRYLEGNPKDRDEVAQIVASLEARIRKQQARLIESQQLAVSPATGAGAASPGPGSQAAAGGTGQPGATAAGPGAGALPGAGAGEPKGGGAAAGGAGGQKPVAAEVAAAKSETTDVKTEDVFAETVVTASKGAQSPLDAPNSTSIITEQDIRLSGIVKIPELLRRLAGVDIMEVTGSQTEVSLRGFNQTLSNKVLVLVDGRSVFFDILGATLWGTLSIGVEDVERIEVVRGPGSALYGADAFNGVINIITKRPGEGKSGVNAGYGDHNQAHGSVWATGRARDFSWKASAGYDYIPNWSVDSTSGRRDVHNLTDDQTTSQRTVRLDLRMTQQITKDIVAGLGGGLATGNMNLIGQGPLVAFDVNGFQNSDITAYVNGKHFESRVFWNSFQATNLGDNVAYLGQTLLPNAARADTVDVELQYIDHFDFGKGIQDDLHIGGGYRFKGVRWAYLDGDRTENHYSGYIHDELKIGSLLAIVGDIRADWVPYLQKVIPSPRVSVMVHPTKQSTIRGIVATAFRTPTLLESYLNLPTQLPFAGGALLAEGVKTWDPTAKLNPENIFTAELGYMNSDFDKITFDSAFFYNHVNNLIELAPNSPLSVGNIATGAVPTGADPNTGLYPIFTGGWDNQCQQYNVYGAELGVRAFPYEGLDVFGNYTLMKVAEDNSSCSVAQKGLIVPDARTSGSKLNLGVQARSKFGLDGELTFHYVSPQTWAEQITNVAEQRIVYEAFHLDAYTLLNARVGYHFFHNQAEVSAWAFNLLDDKHQEHPYGQTVGRRMMGFFSYKF